MNLGWIGTTKVKRLPTQGKSGQHLATPDGKVFTWCNKARVWVQVYPMNIDETVLYFPMPRNVARHYHSTR